MHHLPGSDWLTLGRRALRDGAWEEARTAFSASLAEHETPEALDGMARALWWLTDVEGAVVWRARAYAAFRRSGNDPVAARTALWLAREYGGVLDNPAAANGWFTRAERLIAQLPDGPAHGWLDLARADRATDPVLQQQYAESAFDLARRHDDAELEIYALARRGLARAVNGRVDEGIADLDEAMAVATGEASEPETLGDTLCTLMLAAEVVGDARRFEQWTQALEGYMASHNHVPLFAFCYTCCGEVFANSGDWRQSEEFFLTAITALERAGQRSRCAHPAARLAQLRIRQGRLEEAEALLAGYRDLPEAVEPLAAVHIARAQYTSAVRLLERRLAQLGETNLLAVPYLDMLVVAHLGEGSRESALRAGNRLDTVASLSRLDRVRGLAEMAQGRIAAAQNDTSGAAARFEAALAAFDRAHMPLEAATARLELAETAAPADPATAVSEAEAALQTFESLGASRRADQAVALLRRLGVGGRTGPRGLGPLSLREREVLALISQGLTNNEIAGRLYISPKTAGNHVSNILSKLGVRHRTEAAAYALRYDERQASGE